jgi:hypothetical protein
VSPDHKFLLLPNQFRVGKKVFVLREKGIALVAIRHVGDDDVVEDW